MILKIKNKFSLTGSSSVKDESGKDVFFVKGSFGGNLINTKTKTIYDTNKKKLYVIKNIVFDNVYKVHILNDKNENILSISESLIFRGKYEIEGTKEKMTIIRSSDPNVIWEFNVGKKIIGKTLKNKMTLLDSFTLQVFDEKDAALLVAIIIAMDNIKDKRSKKENQQWSRH